MDRFFMFTWRTYGTWLPGEPGFVGKYVTGDVRRTIDHSYGTPTTDPMPALAGYCRSVQTADEVRLTLPQAGGVIQGIVEAEGLRRHTVHAAAVMDDHVHLVFDAADPMRDMGRMLADWKALVTYRLNGLFGTRPWWADKGSKRWYPRAAFGQVVRYVRDQEGVLAAKFSSAAEASLAESRLEPGTQ